MCKMIAWVLWPTVANNPPGESPYGPVIYTASQPEAQLSVWTKDWCHESSLWTDTLLSEIWSYLQEDSVRTDQQYKSSN